MQYCIIQVFVIEFVGFAVDFILFTVQFVGCAIQFSLFAIELVGFAVEFSALALEFIVFAQKFIIATLAATNQLLITRWTIFTMESWAISQFPTNDISSPETSLKVI